MRNPNPQAFQGGPGLQPVAGSTGSVRLQSRIGGRPVANKLLDLSKFSNTLANIAIDASQESNQEEFEAGTVDSKAVDKYFRNGTLPENGSVHYQEGMHSLIGQRYAQDLEAQVSARLHDYSDIQDPNGNPKSGIPDVNKLMAEIEESSGMEEKLGFLSHAGKIAYGRQREQLFGEAQRAATDMWSESQRKYTRGLVVEQGKDFLKDVYVAYSAAGSTLDSAAAASSIEDWVTANIYKPRFSEHKELTVEVISKAVHSISIDDTEQAHELLDIMRGNLKSGSELLFDDVDFAPEFEALEDQINDRESDQRIRKAKREAANTKDAISSFKEKNLLPLMAAQDEGNGLEALETLSDAIRDNPEIYGEYTAAVLQHMEEMKPSMEAEDDPAVVKTIHEMMFEGNYEAAASYLRSNKSLLNTRTLVNLQDSIQRAGQTYSKLLQTGAMTKKGAGAGSGSTTRAKSPLNNATLDRHAASQAETDAELTAASVAKYNELEKAGVIDIDAEIVPFINELRKAGDKENQDAVDADNKVVSDLTGEVFDLNLRDADATSQIEKLKGLVKPEVYQAMVEDNLRAIDYRKVTATDDFNRARKSLGEQLSTSTDPDIARYVGMAGEIGSPFYKLDQAYSAEFSDRVQARYAKEVQGLTRPAKDAEKRRWINEELTNLAAEFDPRYDAKKKELANTLTIMDKWRSGEDATTAAEDSGTLDTAIAAGVLTVPDVTKVVGENPNLPMDFKRALRDAYLGKVTPEALSQLAGEQSAIINARTDLTEPEKNKAILEMETTTGVSVDEIMSGNIITWLEMDLEGRSQEVSAEHERLTHVLEDLNATPIGNEMFAGKYRRQSVGRIEDKIEDAGGRLADIESKRGELKELPFNPKTDFNPFSKPIWDSPAEMEQWISTSPDDEVDALLYQLGLDPEDDAVVAEFIGRQRSAMLRLPRTAVVSEAESILGRLQAAEVTSSNEAELIMRHLNGDIRGDRRMMINHLRSVEDSVEKQGSNQILDRMDLLRSSLSGLNDRDVIEARKAAAEKRLEGLASSGSTQPAIIRKRMRQRTQAALTDATMQLTRLDALNRDNIADRADLINRNLSTDTLMARSLPKKIKELDVQRKEQKEALKKLKASIGKSKDYNDKKKIAAQDKKFRLINTQVSVLKRQLANLNGSMVEN